MRDKISFWKHFCSDLSKVENYEQAIKNPKEFTLHHRLETHTSDGDKRMVFLQSKELIALGMYYNRPPDELVFIKSRDHRVLHNLDKERLRKMKETMNSNSYQNSGLWKKGHTAWNKGLKVKEASKVKIKESLASNPNSRQNKVKRLAKLYKEDNKGLTWNQFQQYYREEI